MLFILDNYDSFTYNLVQRFGEIDARLDVKIARNDQVTITEIEAMQPKGIVVSPGPCTPHEAGIFLVFASAISQWPKSFSRQSFVPSD